MFRNCLEFAAVVSASCLVAAGLARAAEGAGSTQTDGGKPAAVREIDLRGYNAEWKSGSALKPVEITTPAGLAGAVPDEEWRAKISRQVDFSKEKLLFFVWLGSAGDRLTLSGGADKAGPAVVFRYAEMYEHMMTAPQHFRLYVLPRTVAWEVQAAEKGLLSGDLIAPNKDFPAPKPSGTYPGAADGGVTVLSAEATVELRGLLVHTPKGTFILVRENGAPATWEVDVGKRADLLGQQLKDLSGTAVVINGTCKMAPATAPGGPTTSALPGGGWRLEKTVTVARLVPADNK